jgi:hypothetical protein
MLATYHLDHLQSITLSWYLYLDDQPYPYDSTVYIKSRPELLVKAKAAFVTYDAVWAAFAALPGLRTLRVALQTSSPRLNDMYRGNFEWPVKELREKWLGPIGRLKDKSLANFELVLDHNFAEQLWGAQSHVRLYNNLPPLQPVSIPGEIFMLSTVDHNTFASDLLDLD